MKCEHCGHENPEDKKYCEECGEFLGQEAVVEEETEQMDNESSTSETEAEETIIDAQVEEHEDEPETESDKEDKKSKISFIRKRKKKDRKKLFQGGSLEDMEIIEDEPEELGHTVIEEKKVLNWKQLLKWVFVSIFATFIIVGGYGLYSVNQVRTQLNEEIETLEKENKKQAKEITNLENQLDTSSVDYQKQINDLTKDNNDLTKENNDLQKQLDDANDELEQAQEDVKAAEKAQKKAEDDLASYKKKNSSN